MAWVYRVFLLLVLLVLGAIVNVGVAWWASASYVRRPTRPLFEVYTAPTVPAWLVSAYECFGFRFIEAQSMADQFWLDSAKSSMSAVSPDQLVLVPRCKEPPPKEFVSAGMYRLDAAGWPLLALTYEREGTFDFQSRVFFQSDLDGGIALPPADPAAADRWRDRALPLRPLINGFTVNTLFYAILGLLLLAFVWAARRLLRYERGSCPACGYSLPDSGSCSECGWRHQHHAT